MRTGGASFGRAGRRAGPAGRGTAFPGGPDPLGTLGDSVIEARQREATVAGERALPAPSLGCSLSLSSCPFALSPVLAVAGSPPALLPQLQPSQYTPRPRSSDFQEMEGQKLGPPGPLPAPPQPPTVTPQLRWLRIPHPRPPAPAILKVTQFFSAPAGPGGGGGEGAPCPVTKTSLSALQTGGKRCRFSRPDKALRSIGAKSGGYQMPVRRTPTRLPVIS